MRGGWIKVHRKIVDWEWWSDHNTARLFIYLLLEANHEDMKYKGMVIGRGQVLTSIRALSTNTGISVRGIRTSLSHLISTQEITQTPTHRFTIITICKYEDYQPTEEDTDTPTDTNNDNQPTQHRHSNKQEHKNNIYITHSVNARTCEGNGWEDNYFFEAYGNAVWREFVRMRTLLSEDELNDALKMFQMECRCREKTHISHADWKSHFFDWLLKKLKSNKQNNGNKKCFTIDEIDAIVQAGIGNADTERR